MKFYFDAAETVIFSTGESNEAWARGHEGVREMQRLKYHQMRNHARNSINEYNILAAAKSKHNHPRHQSTLS